MELSRDRLSLWCKMRRRSACLGALMYVSGLRCATRVLLGVFLLWALLSAQAQPNGLVDQDVKRREPLPCASTADTIPSGLAVVLPPRREGIQIGEFRSLNNPFVSGVAVQINWRDIEPVQGNRIGRS